jgi:nucleoside-diphosphate-sugar epimerase
LLITVLITGANGFIGTYAANTFRQFGWQVIELSRRRQQNETGKRDGTSDVLIKNDLSDHNALLKIIDRYRPQACIHLAAPASVPDSFKNPAADFTAQLLPLLNLLEAIRLSERQINVLLVSSAAVYGNQVTLPIEEEQKLNPLSPYGYHKQYQEQLLDQYVAIYGLKGCKARVFSTYGVGLMRLAVWDITKRALAGDYILYGTGEESRDYLHVSDVARALLSVVERDSFSGEAINIASGCETKIVDLAETIYKLLGTGEKVRLIPSDENNKDPLRWRADIRRLNSLGFQASVDLECGLASTIQWIKLNA